jgi:hypothetical protein
MNACDAFIKMVKMVNIMLYVFYCNYGKTVQKGQGHPVPSLEATDVLSVKVLGCYEQGQLRWDPSLMGGAKMPPAPPDPQEPKVGALSPVPRAQAASAQGFLICWKSQGSGGGNVSVYSCVPQDLAPEWAGGNFLLSLNWGWMVRSEQEWAELGPVALDTQHSLTKVLSSELLDTSS